MKAETYDLMSVLEKQRRFLVPTFQRAYEWSEDEQWSLMFDDLLATASRLQSSRDRAEREGEAIPDAERRVAPHFLGAIVLDQLPSRAGEIDVRAVIDGQQRLTTIQLLTRALADVVTADEPGLSRRLQRMLFNELDDDREPDEFRYKLWPRSRDRDAWQLAMGDAPYSDGTYGKARVYFAKRIRETIGQPGVGEVTPSSSDDEGADGTLSVGHLDLSTLVDTVRGLFKIVVIDLDPNDDAQVIFEVLNGRQQELSAADLVKNLLFLRAEITDEGELEHLHRQYWERLEDDWWRVKTGTGHASRERREQFLAAWLSTQRGQEANVGRLYGEIRQYLTDGYRKVHEVLAEIAEFSDSYRRVVEPDGMGLPARTADTYRTLNRLKVFTPHPLLMWLETRPEAQLSPEDRETAVRAVESWVVRRLVTKRNTRGYGSVFLSVLGSAAGTAHQGGSSHEIALAAVTALAIHSQDWPSDEELRTAFTSETFYDYFSQERIRMILGSIDKLLAAEHPKAEYGTFDYDRLTIEHLLPQSWHEVEEWKVGDDPDAVARRDKNLHRIGNLTLVTRSLNPALSNGSWSEKAPEIWRHSKLELNATLPEVPRWDEDAIDARARALAEVAIRRWPSPQALGYMPIIG